MSCIDKEYGAGAEGAVLIKNMVLVLKELY
jgi:hypothetical protein